MIKLKVTPFRSKPCVEGTHSIRRVLWFTFILAVIFLATGCSPRHYVAKAKEEIYGTWTSTQRSPHKLVMLPDGTWEEYIYESDAAPTYKGTFQIIDKWKDAEGNVWYKEFVTLTFPAGTKEMTQELDKIDKSGRVWEFDFNYVPKYEPGSFPKEINPKGNDYGIYQRSGK